MVTDTTLYQSHNASAAGRGLVVRSLSTGLRLIWNKGLARAICLAPVVGERSCWQKKPCVMKNQKALCVAPVHLSPLSSLLGTVFASRQCLICATTARPPGVRFASRWVKLHLVKIWYIRVFEGWCWHFKCQCSVLKGLNYVVDDIYSCVPQHCT